MLDLNQFIGNSSVLQSFSLLFCVHVCEYTTLYYTVLPIIVVITSAIMDIFHWYMELI